MSRDAGVAHGWAASRAGNIAARLRGPRSRRSGLRSTLRFVSDVRPGHARSSFAGLQRVSVASRRSFATRSRSGERRGPPSASTLSPTRVDNPILRAPCEHLRQPAAAWPCRSRRHRRGQEAPPLPTAVVAPRSTPGVAATHRRAERPTAPSSSAKGQRSDGSTPLTTTIGSGISAGSSRHLTKQPRIVQTLNEVPTGGVCRGCGFRFRRGASRAT
jgi:hypothetical protein